MSVIPQDRTHQLLLLVLLRIPQPGIGFPRENWGLGCLSLRGRVQREDGMDGGWKTSNEMGTIPPVIPR